jgi:hypothetical protein
MDDTGVVDGRVFIAFGGLAKKKRWDRIMALPARTLKCEGRNLKSGLPWRRQGTIGVKKGKLIRNVLSFTILPFSTLLHQGRRQNDLKTPFTFQVLYVTTAPLPNITKLYIN